MICQNVVERMVVIIYDCQCVFDVSFRNVFQRCEQDICFVFGVNFCEQIFCGVDLRMCFDDRKDFVVDVCEIFDLFVIYVECV